MPDVISQWADVFPIENPQIGQEENGFMLIIQLKGELTHTESLGLWYNNYAQFTAM